MLDIAEQKVLKDLVSKSDLQKHIFGQSEHLIWDQILSQFNSITKQDLSIEDLREEWTHIYQTIGYTNSYSNTKSEAVTHQFSSFVNDHEYLRSPHKT